jgi:hypothetical protein
MASGWSERVMWAGWKLLLAWLGIIGFGVLVIYLLIRAVLAIVEWYWP